MSRTESLHLHSIIIIQTECLTYYSISSGKTCFPSKLGRMCISLMIDEMHLWQNSVVQTIPPTYTYLVAKNKYGNHDEYRGLYSKIYTKPHRFTQFSYISLPTASSCPRTKGLQSPHIQNERNHVGTKVVWIQRKNKSIPLTPNNWTDDAKIWSGCIQRLHVIQTYIKRWHNQVANSPSFYTELHCKCYLIKKRKTARQTTGLAGEWLM